MSIYFDVNKTLNENNFFPKSKNLDEAIERMKLYYGIPRSERDNPSLGNKWKEFPETEGHNCYFEYDHNSAGFRDTEIETDVDICYFGCSVTYGVGVPSEDRYTDLVNQHFGFKSNNFGISGVSSEEMLKMFLTLSKFINTKKAVFSFPDIHRYVMPINDLRINMHPNFEELYDDSNILKISRHFYQLPEEYFVDKFKVCIHTIINIAQTKNIELYLFSWNSQCHELLIEETTHYDNVKIISPVTLDHRGRDSFIVSWGHPGINWHRETSKVVVNAISS